MGNACCNSKTVVDDLPAQQGSNNKAQSKQPSDLTKSFLLISKDMNNIISRSGGLLHGTSLPENRDSNSSLILGAGGSNDPKKLVRFFLIAAFYINKYNAKDAEF